MHPFRTWPRARLFCRADFALGRVLNIDFLTPGGATAPLHLSLRAAEGVAVVNRRHLAGWRRELVWPFAPGPEPVPVEVAFWRGMAWVRVGGRLLGQFDALPRPTRGGRYGLRRGFPGLGRIAAVRLVGALEPDSLRLFGPEAPGPDPTPVLTEALELRWRPPCDQDPSDPVSLTAPGLGAPVTAILRLGPEAWPDGSPVRSYTALVPGRVWAGGAEAVDLRLTGTPALRLTRADLAARLGDIAATGLWATDDLAALQAIEHVRHARLWPALPDQVRTALAAAARRLRVDDWLLDGLEAPAAAPPAPLAGPAARDQLGALLVEGRHAEATEAAAARLRDPATPREARQALARELVQGFAAAGLLDWLARQTLEAGLLPLPERDDAWWHSTALPFDWVQGRFGTIVGRLGRLKASVPGWVVTPAVGWAMTQMARLAADPSGRMPDRQTYGAAVTAFGAYLGSLAGDPEGRGPCVALMAGARAILACPERLNADEARAFDQAVVRLWGLNPTFWAGFEDTIPPSLRPAAALCDEIVRLTCQPERDAAALDAALSAATIMGMADAPRFRRDLLGPAGLPGGRPEAAAYAQRGLDAGEASLRALVHPEGGGTADPATAEAAAEGLRAAYRHIPTAPNGAAERALLTRARVLLAEPAVAALADWGRAACLHAGPQAQAVGVTLALGLAAGLARAGGPAETVLQPMLDAPPEPSPGIEGPDLALAVLARHAPGLAARAAAALHRPAPAPRPADPLAEAADPIFDTLVAVYSCRQHLETRLPHLRETWLADLDALGIPWLVFTGGGDGSREGRIVALDAPDDYEGLPDKTLAMVRWVLENTAISRLLKVDDDCYLHAPGMFGDLALLRHPYLGRVLSLVPGRMDRSWHMAKSAGPRGQLELDKSPAQARYADGGSGYVLSRGAMAALIAAAESPPGQRLRQVSFMEDKLVGDLLALRGITPSAEDWRVGVWRRPGPGKTPLPAFEHGLLPFAGAPLRLAHLDDAGAMARVRATARAPLPRQGTVWPTDRPVRLGNGSNALELISPRDRLARARRARVAVVACLRNERTMVPAFLNHYRRLGVEGFLIVDNGSTDGTFELLADQPDVALFHAATEYRQSHYGVAWQQAMLGNFREGEWSLVADADEFLVLPGGLDGLPELVETAGLREADAARILMLDLYPRGPLSEVTLASGDPFAETGWADREAFLRRSPARGHYSDSEIVTSGLRHRLLPGSRAELFTAQKVALLRYRPWMQFGAGLHFVAGTRRAPGDLLFAHFKYTAAFRAKVLAEIRRGQHFNDAEEYRRYQALLAEGRETLWDPEASVPWREVPEVRRLLGA